MKTVFLDAYNQINHVKIQFKSLADIDLNGLQLFCSAHQAFAKANKTMDIDLTNASIFNKNAKKLGLIRHKGCHLETSENCLWRKRSSR
jgi:hypothetical protein